MRPMKAHPPVFVNNLYSAKIPDKCTHDEEKTHFLKKIIADLMSGSIIICKGDR